MKTIAQSCSQSVWAVLSIVAVVCAGCANMTSVHNVQLTLSGSQEVPPVTTAATGHGNLVIAADKSVSGSILTSGVVGVAAHIHDGAPGKNGPVIVPLTKASDSTWSVPANAKFTDAQYESFMAGNLYVNVHSAANKGGEIRGQLKP